MQNKPINKNIRKHRRLKDSEFACNIKLISPAECKTKYGLIFDGHSDPKINNGTTKVGKDTEKLVTGWLAKRLMLSDSRILTFNTYYQNRFEQHIHELDAIAFDGQPTCLYEIKASRNSRIYSLGWQKLEKLVSIGRQRWPGLKGCYLFFNTAEDYKGHYSDFTEFDPLNLKDVCNKFVFKYSKNLGLMDEK